jgi:hypothetical protein
MIDEQAQSLSEYENAMLFIREIENKRESFIEGTISLPVINQ